MRKIKTTDIVGSTIEMPVKAGHVEHIQNSFTELIQDMLKSFAGFDTASANIYVLYGCERTGTGDNYIITAGAVYYNGEVYRVDASTFTVTPGNTAVAVLETTQYTAVDSGANPKGDPIIFTDTVARNVLDIRKIQIIDGSALSPDYIATFSTFLFPLITPIAIGAHSNTLTSISAVETTLVNDVVPSTFRSGKAIVMFNSEYRPNSGSADVYYIITTKIKVNGITVCSKDHTVLNDGAHHLVHMAHWLATLNAGDVVKITAVTSVPATVVVNHSDYIIQALRS